MLDVESNSLRQKRLMLFMFKKTAPKAEERDMKVFPYVNAGVLSKMFFWWTNPVMKVGYTRTLEPNDLFKLEGEWLVDSSTEKIKRELAKYNYRDLDHKIILKIIVRTFWTEWLAILLLLSAYGAIESFSPLVSKQLILAIEHRVTFGGSVAKGVGIAVASSFMNFIVEVLVALASFRGLALGTKLKSTFTALIMEKSFRLSAKGRHKFSPAKITLICTTDLSRVEILSVYTSYLLISPIPVVVSIVILAINLGVTAVVAISLITIASVSLSMSVTKLFKYRSFVVGITDKRVTIMREIVSNLKIIKFYNWEIPYFSNLMDARTKEIKVVLKIQALRNVLNTVSTTLTAIVSMVSFIVMNALDAGTKSAADVFSSVQSFSTLSVVLNILPNAISLTADMINGLKRVAELLAEEENEDNGHYFVSEKGKGPALEVKDATFIWEQFEKDEEEEDDDKGKKKKKARNSKGLEETGNSQDTETSNLEEPGNDVSVELSELNSSKLTSLANVNLTIAEGEFVVVTGSIGSGKSSLLSALAGAMTCVAGTVAVNGKLVLCGELWVQNLTIRENITFGLPFDQARYDQIIYCCSLQADLDVLPGGDLTEVGEKGITLSGGQKARICLARALYYGGDIVLMDDVLSAVDARVGKHIVEQCCLGFLAAKTRILATHQLSLVQKADKVIFMNGDGTFDIGTFKEIESNPQFAKLLLFNQQEKEQEKEKEKEVENDRENEQSENFTEQFPGTSLTFPEDSQSLRKVLDDSVDIAEAETIGSEDQNLAGSGQELKRRLVRKTTTEDPDEKAKIAKVTYAEVDEEAEYKDVYANKDALKGKLIEDEEKAVNSLSGFVYKRYISFGAGRLTMSGFLVLLTFITAMAVFNEIFSTTWLSFWVSDEFHRLSAFYIAFYVVFTMLFFVFLLLEFVTIGIAASNALKKLNVSAARKVLGAPMKFLDVTPMGRILNRFTKDTDALDNEIADTLKRLLYSLSYIVGLIVLNVVYLPWIAIVIPVLAVVYVGVANYYQASSREIKRLEAVKRSMVYNNLSEVLTGMRTIKAYGRESLFLEKNGEYMDKTNEATFLSNGVSRWLGICLQMIASVFGLFVCVLSAAGVFHLSAATVGLLVNNVISLTAQLSAVTMYITQLENDMNSVERLIYYADNIPQEETAENRGLEPSDWPKLGKLQFQNVTLLYRSGLPPVLKNLNFSVASGEKIGVCGRTGAGKSLVMAAIFRLHELDSGTITYDGMDISKLALTSLRSNLSIIPQEPVLFTGTIRKNLDPFAERSDDVLWDILRRSEILSEEEILVERAKTEGKAGGTVKAETEHLHKFHLDQVVTDEGANYSVGERQLISFARALVRNTQILILDEATSSVDYETDHKIQNTINREFAHCTILCIAHRLKTILHYDKILALDKGEIKQFDKPKVLFGEDGIFRQMCDRLGITRGDF